MECGFDIISTARERIGCIKDIMQCDKTYLIHELLAIKLKYFNDEKRE